MSPKTVAEAYLTQHRNGGEDIEAFEAVIEACNKLDEGFPIALCLIEAAANESELAYVAAGPIEDLLKWHGLPAIKAFESAAEQSPKVRQALAGVWIGPKYEAFAHWKSLMDKYHPGAFNWDSAAWKAR